MALIFFSRFFQSLDSHCSSSDSSFSNYSGKTVIFSFFFFWSLLSPISSLLSVFSISVFFISDLSKVFLNDLKASLCKCSLGINFTTWSPFQLHRIPERRALDFYLISREPSPRKLTRMPTILSNYFSQNRGKNAIAYSTFTIESLIGTALAV